MMRSTFRACGVTALLLLCELIRQTSHMHALVQRDLANAGVAGVSPDVFEVAPSLVPVWILWLLVLSACFLAIASLYRRQLGRTFTAIVRAGTLAWVATFGMAWLSFLAFGIATVKTAAIGLAGAWLESLLVAGVAIWWPDARASSGLG